MTRADFLTWLARVAAAALVLALALRLLLGAQWFSLYGWASIALATLPFVHRLLRLRLPSVGRRRALALVYSVPLGLWSAGRILFWNAFFSGDANLAVMLGSARHMFWTHAGRVVPMLVTLLVLAWIVIFSRAAGFPIAAAVEADGSA